MRKKTPADQKKKTFPFSTIRFFKKNKEKKEPSDQERSVYSVSKSQSEKKNEEKKSSSDQKRTPYRIRGIRFGRMSEDDDEPSILRCAYCDEIISMNTSSLPPDTPLICQYCGHENTVHDRSKTTIKHPDTKTKLPPYKRYDPEQDDSSTLQCSYCDEIITLFGPMVSDTSIACPHCGHENKFTPISELASKTIEQKESKWLKHRIQTKDDDTQTEKKASKNKIVRFLSDNLIELILISIGLAYLIDPTIANIKISFTLILIATFLLFLMTGEDELTPYSEKDYQTSDPFFKRKPHTHPFIKKIRSTAERIRSIPLSNRISIVLILWTLFLFIITAEIEIYFILVFIGVLITRELTDLYTSDLYKKRLNAYIILFLLAYVVLIGQKIIEIISS
ncbi:MAG: hypothetical protein QCI00_09015 [Candidatus Thermoplasmatota archaeon]|nr:hypothetical protein [Candidatus Thermoplasmatota archaeon]